MTKNHELKQKALTAHRQGRLEEALDLYLTLLEGKSGDSSDLYGNIGSIYFELGEIKNSQNFLEKGLKIAKKNQNQVTRSAINRYLGRVFRHQGHLDKAILCFKESEILLTKLNKQEKLLSTVLALGETYFQMRQRVEAEQYLYQALNLALKNKDQTRGHKAQELLNQLKEHNTLDTLAMAEISSLNLERTCLSKLQEINLAINQQVPLENLLALIVDKAIELTQAGRGFLVLKKDHQLEIRTARSAGGSNLKTAKEISANPIIEYCYHKKEAFILENIDFSQKPFNEKKYKKLEICSLLAVPLHQGNDINGLFYLDSPLGGTRFSPTDLENLAIFSSQATIAMETARLFDENQIQRKKLEVINQELHTQVDHQEQEIDSLKEQLQNLNQLGAKFPHIIGESESIKRVLKLVDQVADTDLNIIIHGESGTGKELIAQALHQRSQRQKKPFISENCGAIPHNLLKSILFGHLKGSFTGAIEDKEGLFQLAHEGTLFLDEIGEMPHELQSSLLRVLENGKVRPIGGTESFQTNCRIICATHQNLNDKIKANEFRQDLFYRLNGITIEIPPLRDRKEDIPLLIRHFLRKQPNITVTAEAMNQLCQATWLGNIRQLANEIKRWIALGYTTIDKEQLSPENVGEKSKPIISGLNWQNRPLKEIIKEAVDMIERETLLATLKKNNGQKSATARELGISRPTLDAKLKKLNIID